MSTRPPDQTHRPSRLAAARRTVGALGPVFLLASVNSILWLAWLPPSWNYIDSIVVMLYDIGPGVMPHFPPLYPLLTRTVNFLASHALEPGAPTLRAWGGGNLTDSSLYALMVFQHLWYATAVTYFARSVADTLGRRLLAVLPFFLTPALSLFNHGVFSEGPWISTLLMLLGSMVQILRAERFSPALLALHAALWIPALLARHLSFIFAFMLPATFLGLAALEWRQWRRHVGRAFVVAAVSIGALLATSGLNRIIFASFGVPGHSVFGRSGVYHMTMTDWNSVPIEDREALVRSIQARCSGPLAAGAVPIILANRSPWTGTWNDVNVYLKAQPPELIGGRELGVLTDLILNEVTGQYMRSANPWYRARVEATLLEYWKYFRTQSQAWEVVRLGPASFDLYAKDTGGSFAGVQSVGLSGKARYEAVGGGAYFGAGAWWLDVRLAWLLAGLLAIGCFCRLPKPCFVLCFAGVLNLVIYFVAISLITTNVVRYALASSILLAPLLGLVLASLQVPAFFSRRRGLPE